MAAYVIGIADVDYCNGRVGGRGTNGTGRVVVVVVVVVVVIELSEESLV